MTNPPDSAGIGWWVGAAGVVGAVLGAMLKTIGELIGRRDTSNERMRSDLMAWNERQQVAITRLEAGQSELREKYNAEQQLRHELRNQLGAARMELELSMQELAAAQAEIKVLKAENERLCAGLGVKEKSQ